MPKTIVLDSFRYLTSEAWRALLAVEMGMKNHEVVPIELIQKISRCRRTGSGFTRLVKDQLIPYGLVAYSCDQKKAVSGYRLTNLGYDYLALHQLFNSGQLCDVNSMIGAGKESDVYLASAGDNCGVWKDTNLKNDRENVPLVESGQPVVIKFHRLGRTSFRKVKEKRDYHQHRNTCSWLYLDRIASQREFTMMQALRSNRVEVPVPLAHNRNAVVMSYIEESVQLSRVLPFLLKAADGLLARHLYVQAREMLHHMCSIGLIHGDFNEFNLMVVGLRNVDLNTITNVSILKVTLVLIDFPQMISRDHPLAESIYQRDSECIVHFFSRYFEIPEGDLPSPLSEVNRTAHVDIDVKAPGYPCKNRSRRKPMPAFSEMLLGCTLRRISTELSDTDSESTQGDASDNSLNSLEDEEEKDEVGSEDSWQTATEVLISENEEGGLGATVSKSVDNVLTDGTTDDEVSVAHLQSESDVGITYLDQKSKQTELTNPKASSGFISREEILARHRREQRKKEQTKFQKNIKRHSRANFKRSGRASINAELTLFG
ncbi:unnamed protein product [Dicrocoelium dendriticum]|nr:unnamed protein product [Dicrocoelium dendriticum]